MNDSEWFDDVYSICDYYHSNGYGLSYLRKVVDQLHDSTNYRIETYGYQRKKGRDLLNFWLRFKEFDLIATELMGVFQEYLVRQGLKVTRQLFLDPVVYESAGGYPQ